MIGDEVSGELALWGAVFEEGIRAAVRDAAHGFSGPNINWATSSVIWPGSCLWLCQLFNIDQKQVIGKVLEKAAKERAKNASH